MTTRAARLLTLLDVLRRARTPQRGARLAQQLGVSLRTLYRDIASLREQGAHIEGDPGVGYLLRPGFLLPPLMFSADELEALTLGARWVASQADAALAAAAHDAIARIEATLAPELRLAVQTSGLLVPGWRSPRQGAEEPWLPTLRSAVRDEHAVRIRYRDETGHGSERTIWPFALAFFAQARLVVAWCMLRQDFRHFRADRIEALETTGVRYPSRRHTLLARWQAEHRC